MTESHNPSLLSRIREQANQQPDAVAFASSTGHWTFGEFDLAASQLANTLVSRGVGAGDRVACLTRHTPETLLLWLAAAKIGAVCMPVNWRLSAREVQWILTNGRAKILLADADFSAVVASLDESIQPNVIGVHEAFGPHPSLRDLIAGYPANDPGHHPADDDTAIQLYSSGTTGLPKGVELTWANLTANLQVLPETLDYEGKAHVMFSALPAFHIAGVIVGLLTYSMGARLIVLPDFVPATVLDTLVAERVTHSFFVPAMIQFLLQVPDVESRDFSHLQGISYGASPITQKVLLRGIAVFKCNFSQVYGLTETTGAVTVLKPAEHQPDSAQAWKLRSAGKAMPGVELRIADPESGEILADGQVGEVQIRTIQNLARYWQNETATDEALVPDDDGLNPPWFRSGDAGYMQDGYLFLHDRIKDMIISGGENIYPAEVENILMQSPMVADGAVAGVPDEQWGEAVKAFVVIAPGMATDEAALLEFMRERLAHFKCPRSVDWVKEIPRNPSGKILKRVLREPYLKTGC